MIRNLFQRFQPWTLRLSLLTRPNQARSMRGTLKMSANNCPNNSIYYQKPPKIPAILRTPNPDSIKFLPGGDVLGGERYYDFPNRNSASCSNLATLLFHIEGVRNVFFGTYYVTVSKEENFKWNIIGPKIFSTVVDYFASKAPILSESKLDSNVHAEDDDTNETVKIIKELLDTRIRHVAHRDGGDIIFVGFQDGVVKLKLQGSLSAWPNSNATVKNALRNMFQFYSHGVQSVEQVFEDSDVVSHEEIQNSDKVTDLQQTAVETETRQSAI